MFCVKSLTFDFVMFIIKLLFDFEIGKGGYGGMQGAIMIPEDKREITWEDKGRVKEDVNAFSALEETASYDFGGKSIHSLGYLDKVDKTWVDL